MAQDRTEGLFNLRPSPLPRLILRPQHATLIDSQEKIYPEIQENNQEWEVQLSIASAIGCASKLLRKVHMQGVTVLQVLAAPRAEKRDTGLSIQHKAAADGDLMCIICNGGI